MSSSRPKLTPASNRTAILKTDIAKLTTNIDSIQVQIESLKKICDDNTTLRDKKGDCAQKRSDLERDLYNLIRQHSFFLDELTRIEAAAKKGGKPKTQNRKRNKSSHRQSRKVRRRRTSRTR